VGGRIRVAILNHGPVYQVIGKARDGGYLEVVIRDDVLIRLNEVPCCARRSWEGIGREEQRIRYRYVIECPVPTDANVLLDGNIRIHRQ
jgi:hypothetical protein